MQIWQESFWGGNAFTFLTEGSGVLVALPQLSIQIENSMRNYNGSLDGSTSGCSGQEPTIDGLDAQSVVLGQDIAIGGGVLVPGIHDGFSHVRVIQT